MKKHRKKVAFATLMSAALVLPTFAEEGDHDDEHEDHSEYIDEGAVDIALEFHAEETEIEFAVFGGEDHGHEDDEHDDEEHSHDEGDEHGHDDEHEHGEGTELDEAVIVGGAGTALVLPDSGELDFLGDAGTTVYRLPQDTMAGPAAPGLVLEFEESVFVENEATISLTGLEGPGELIAYIVDGFGEVTVVFDSRDGLDTSDAYTGPGESHQHLNWVFTATGEYTLDLAGSATLISGGEVLTVTGELEVEIDPDAEEHSEEEHGEGEGKEHFDEGAIDIALVYHAEEGELEFVVFGGEDHGHNEDDEHDEGDEHGHDEDDEHGHDDEHEHGEGLSLDEAVIVAGSETVLTLPESGEFSFLGEVGAEVYVLPQDTTAGPAAPGLVLEFEEGIFVENEATISLTGLEGPGDLIAYIVDGFGSVTTVFDSRDGFDQTDAYTGPGESHQHLNWAFTQPGIYHLELQGEATLVSTSETLTTSGELHIQVGEGLAYLEEVDDYDEGWANTDGLGFVYTDFFPWLYVPMLNSWSFASGEGGENMFLYVENLESWLWTGADLAPWFYNLSSSSWVFVIEDEDGDSYIFDTVTGEWTPLQ